MTTVEEGIIFILSHFREPIFPRRIFTPIQKQIKIENTNEILKYFKESKYYDCRISAFTFLEKYQITIHGPQPPDILFIDLDASQFKTGRALYQALINTLKNIQDRFNSNSQSTILESGSGGYHIIQPLQILGELTNSQNGAWIRIKSS